MQPVRAFAFFVLLGLLSPGGAAGQQQVPIIDLNFHPADGWDIDALVRLFDQVGVESAGNGAAAGADSLALHFAAGYPSRFIPFAGQTEILVLIQLDGERAWRLDSPGIIAYLSKLEIGLRFGKFKGIGLLFPNSLDSPRVGTPAMRYPVDSPLMRRLWSYSATYGVPISVHLEATAQSVAEMEQLLRTDPKGTLIWAHTGYFAEPALLRRLFDQYDNLFCDLSRRDERPMLIALPISEHHRLRSKWKAFLEEFPDRFVIGTDVGVPSIYRYRQLIAYWREILAQLTSTTAEKLAHQNARRILRLSPSAR